MFIFIFTHRYFNKIINKEKKFVLKTSQSYLYKFLSNYERMQEERASAETQASKYLQQQYVKVMIYDNAAYWIKDNQLYSAKLINGEIDSDTTHQVDTISMNDVELKKMMFVVEKLTGGMTNDSSSSGESKF